MSQYKKSEDTRNKILQSAATLFYERGYEATTVRDIAELSGVSLSRLNYHYTSKAELAATICKSFLRSINDQVYRSIFSLTNDLLLKDVIHIRLIAKGFISKEINMRFYYEIACANIITEILVESGLLHFIEQAEFLGLDISRDRLRAYSHVFVAALVEIIKNVHEGDPNFTESQFLDLYNDLHLKLLDVPQEKRATLLQSAREITGQMRIELENISAVKIIIPTKETERNSADGL